MATKPEEKEEDKFVPGYESVDRKGVWVKSNAQFPLEDPTPVHEGRGSRLTRFEPQSFTQATYTPWLHGQWLAGTFEKFEGDPRDDGVKPVARPEATAAAPASSEPAAPATPAQPAKK